MPEIGEFLGLCLQESMGSRILCRQQAQRSHFFPTESPHALAPLLFLSFQCDFFFLLPLSLLN